MPRKTSSFSDTLHGQPPEFSLVLGGPLYQLLRRSRVADSGLELLHRRILLISLICWLPLFILSAWQGQLLGGVSAIPFLRDVEVHIRFLVVVPLLVGAELVVHRRMRFLIAQFLERNLVAEEDMQRFKSAITSAMRLRNSVLAEVLLVAFVYLVGVLVIWRHYTAIDAESWYSVHDGTDWTLSPAGWWFTFVSLPIFQFLLLRWYFRIFVWARFLWQTSRIDLRLVPTHPDRAGGLGFLSSTAYSYVPLLMAHGAMLAGLYAGRIFYAGNALTDFKLETLGMVIFLLCLVEGPLLVFAPQLAQAKRAGTREYGALAERYVRAFDTKWLRGKDIPEQSMLGSADIQSLADLSSSYEVVQSMRVTLISRNRFSPSPLRSLRPYYRWR